MTGQPDGPRPPPPPDGDRGPAAAFDASCSYELDPKVVMRPEPFGALAYHHGSRRLAFLLSPDLVLLVDDLSR